jgi:Fe-S cluster biogenesis protein NfuA
MTDVRDVGERVERLLAALRSAPGDSGAAAEELVRMLVGLYGDGLARIVAILREADGDRSLTALAGDPLVESLLLLHDLHPLDVDARIQRALDRVRPYLGSHAGGVEYLGVHDGVAKLRLEGSCHGCPSSAATVRLAIEDAILDAAPEVSEVVVDGMTEPPTGPALLQIGRAPVTSQSDRAAGGSAEAAAAAGSAGAAGSAAGHGWFELPAIGPPSARPVIASAGGVEVLICAVRGTLYAYRDGCPSCGTSLAGGALDRERLTCPSCGAGFDVRLAGQGIDSPGLRLDPLPLLADSAGVRVALPVGVLR